MSSVLLQHCNMTVVPRDKMLAAMFLNDSLNSLFFRCLPDDLQKVAV